MTFTATPTNRASMATPTAPGHDANCNVARYVTRWADLAADRAAIIEQQTGRKRKRVGPPVTFARLEAMTNRFANGLAELGIDRGMRILLMVPSGTQFIALVFALFKIGAVPVMIDPGMGILRMLECIRNVDLEGFIGVPKAHAVRMIHPSFFRTVRHLVTVGPRWFWGGSTLEELSKSASDSPFCMQTRSDDAAAILFTSGSTGPAKGVVYEHGMFYGQVQMIQSHYGIEPGEVDLATFPLFALFSVAMGMTVVIPQMNASRPARARPARIVLAVTEHQATSTFGSPALWKNVASYSLRQGIRLPTLRRVLVAGAPVSLRVIRKLHQILSPDADVYTPYGATEALPVASIGGRELTENCVEKRQAGGGICVGKPLPATEVRIIRVSDEPVVKWDDGLELPNGTCGEIVVRGPVVTREYFRLEEATRAAKIADGLNTWHRMGDIGYLDSHGRLWYCGRKSQRVVTASGDLLTACCEEIFNSHPQVNRCALIGVGPRGDQRPAIVVEPASRRLLRNRPAAGLRDELRRLAQSQEVTKMIDDFLFYRPFPVDVRHNAKINREALAMWAAGRTK